MKINPFQCWKAESSATSISEHEFLDDIKQMTMNTGTAGLVSPHLALEREPSYVSPRLASSTALYNGYLISKVLEWTSEPVQRCPGNSQTPRHCLSPPGEQKFSHRLRKYTPATKTIQSIPSFTI